MLEKLFKNQTTLKQETGGANNIPYVKMPQPQLGRAFATLGPLRPVCQLHLLAGTSLCSLKENNCTAGEPNAGNDGPQVGLHCSRGMAELQPPSLEQ